MVEMVALNVKLERDGGLNSQIENIATLNAQTKKKWWL